MNQPVSSIAHTRDAAPRRPLDPVQRLHRFGPIRPMPESRTLLERILFG